MRLKKVYIYLIISILSIPAYVKASTVSFSVSAPTCQGEQIDFTNTTTWGNKYLWRFGDGATSTIEDSRHTYTTAGIYEVTLVVSLGTTSDSLKESITIYSTEYDNLKYEENVSCYPTLLWDTSSSTISRIWDLGDGTISTDSFVSHLYDEPGYYTISITTETTYGCTRTGIFDSLVYSFPRPTAEFSINPSNPTSYDDTIYFVDKSEGEYNSTWYWQLGDGSISAHREPIHKYDSAGEYRVQLIVENDYGCIDTVIHTFYISEMSSWYIPSTFTPNGDGINETFLPVTNNLETKDFEFYVFDKWGKLIFQSNDVNSAWDGSDFRSQKMLTSGVYTWQLKVTYESGFQVKKMGFVNLLAVEYIAR